MHIPRRSALRNPASAIFHSAILAPLPQARGGSRDRPLEKGDGFLFNPDRLGFKTPVPSVQTPSKPKLALPRDTSSRAKPRRMAFHASLPTTTRRKSAVRSHFDVMVSTAVVGVSLWVMQVWLQELDPEQRKAWKMHYRPYVPVLLMVWLWSLNLSVFNRMGLDWRLAFQVKSDNLLPSGTVVRRAAAFLTAVVACSAAAYAYFLAGGWNWLAGYQPLFLLAFFLSLVVVPCIAEKQGSPYFFAQTLRKCILPFQSVRFPEFFLADIYTSLAKPISDLERSVCHLVFDPVMEREGASLFCGNKSWMLAWWLAFPYMIRFIQCIWTYVDHKDRGQLFNAMKYSTAFPVIFFSQLKYHLPEESWIHWCHLAWFSSAMVNSMYSFYWDIERDWELGIFSSHGSITQSRLQFGPKKLYYTATLLNALLRTSWTYKLSTHLRHHETTNFSIALLEVLRRFQWNFFRIETELRRVTTIQTKDHQMTGLKTTHSP